MSRKFSLICLALACLLLWGIGSEAQSQEKRKGTIGGEIKTKKDTPNKKNVVIEVLAAGEEKVDRATVTATARRGVGRMHQNVPPVRPGINGPDGTVDIGVTGTLATQYDRLLIDGPATLDGMLSVALWSPLTSTRMAPFRG